MYLHAQLSSAVPYFVCVNTGSFMLSLIALVISTSKGTGLEVTGYKVVFNLHEHEFCYLHKP